MARCCTRMRVWSWAYYPLLCFVPVVVVWLGHQSVAWSWIRTPVVSHVIAWLNLGSIQWAALLYIMLQPFVVVWLEIHRDAMLWRPTALDHIDRRYLTSTRAVQPWSDDTATHRDGVHPQHVMDPPLWTAWQQVRSDSSRSDTILPIHRMSAVDVLVRTWLEMMLRWMSSSRAQFIRSCMVWIGCAAMSVLWSAGYTLFTFMWTAMVDTLVAVHTPSSNDGTDEDVNWGNLTRTDIAYIMHIWSTLWWTLMCWVLCRRIVPHATHIVYDIRRVLHASLHSVQQHHQQQQLTDEEDEPVDDIQTVLHAQEPATAESATIHTSPTPTHEIQMPMVTSMESPAELDAHEDESLLHSNPLYRRPFRNHLEECLFTRLNNAQHVIINDADGHTFITHDYERSRQRTFQHATQLERDSLQRRGWCRTLCCPSTRLARIRQDAPHWSIPIGWLLLLVLRIMLGILQLGWLHRSSNALHKDPWPRWSVDLASMLLWCGLLTMLWWSTFSLDEWSMTFHEVRHAANRQLHRHHDNNPNARRRRQRARRSCSTCCWRRVRRPLRREAPVPATHDVPSTHSLDEPLGHSQEQKQQPAPSSSKPDSDTPGDRDPGWFQVQFLPQFVVTSMILPLLMGGWMVGLYSSTMYAAWQASFSDGSTNDTSTNDAQSFAANSSSSTSSTAWLSLALQVVFQLISSMLLSHSTALLARVSAPFLYPRLLLLPQMVLSMFQYALFGLTPWSATFVVMVAISNLHNTLSSMGWYERWMIRWFHTQQVQRFQQAAEFSFAMRLFAQDMTVDCIAMLTVPWLLQQTLLQGMTSGTAGSTFSNSTTISSADSSLTATAMLRHPWQPFVWMTHTRDRLLLRLAIMVAARFISYVVLQIWFRRQLNTIVPDEHVDVHDLLKSYVTSIRVPPLMQLYCHQRYEQQASELFHWQRTRSWTWRQWIAHFLDVHQDRVYVVSALILATSIVMDNHPLSIPPLAFIGVDS